MHAARCPGVHGLRTLVADDDFAFLDLVATALERRGAHAVRASCGDELMAAIADNHPFDVVVTDVQMPWMTGLQVMHSVRTAGLRTPTVIMTGSRDPKIAAQVQALGHSFALLYKPFSIAQLLAAVRVCLGRLGASAA